MIRAAASLAILVSLFPATGLAQPPDAGVERELAGIRATLEDIAALMRQQLDASNRDVVLRRIEIKNARLVPVEQELRSIRSQIEGQDAELVRLEAQMRELEERAFYAEDEEEKKAAALNLGELEKFAEQLRAMVAAAQARELETLREIDALDAEIATLEGRLDAPRP
jgi:chromosome segregation ATPase